MQDLRQIRIHPRAFACGQDDEGCAHVMFLFVFSAPPFYPLTVGAQAIAPSN
ncbi:hypothetical protein JL2886_03577 [Phaeobacter gallaeciensis]|uniref:Uncharacterized protein n=1 Tax=Phaeobacter gallaeciensis TaxID=60890 RepID=A0A1B0ZWL0_9RHOB|nr:hypothetical protein JL2886_03577 [Phaeobacter gallaeciensis]